ncbi:MAG: metallophosphoesterase family protein [Sulfitobacter sp.]
MTRFIHLTDLHISHPDAGGPQPKEKNTKALRAVVGIINAMPRQPDFVVVSGDLTDTGHVASYGLLQEILADLRAPLVLGLGNHDKRGAFHEVFGQQQSDAPYYHDQVLGGMHVITLDTLVPGHVAGEICAAQFEFLGAALARERDLPKLIVMHHPPRVDPAGLPWGSVDMASTERLAAMLKGHAVAGILSGHIHIDQVNHWHGVPVIVSTGLDSGIDLLETVDLRLVESTGFGICNLHGSGLSVNFVPLTPAPREIGVIDRARLLSFT